MNKQNIRTNSEFEIVSTETLRPTPDILDALEKDYPLEASIADLVDNSIDAQANRILIRFIKKGGRLVSLCVADDGHGISEKKLSLAMQFAARRTYGPNDLGMFGVGLKTASLSQADTLTVASRVRNGTAAGRQWTKKDIKQNDWSLNILNPHSASSLLEHNWGMIGSIKAGTVVRWDQVSDFDRLRNGIDKYIGEAIGRIQLHLGIKLHRILERQTIRIEIDVEDRDANEAGPPGAVSPINPFPPSNSSGARGFPKDFIAQLPEAGALTMRAHIWPKKSGNYGYKLGGGKVAEHQGLYFYRHDRLIQEGGWCGIIGTSEPHMSLARVEIDIPDTLQSYLKVRSNKAGVDVPATFADAVLAARASDGMDFRKYLDKAEAVYRRRGKQKMPPMLSPGEGIPAEVRSALERQISQFRTGQKCSVVWENLDGENLLDIDQDNRRIILNKKFRSVLLRGARGGKTDLPLLRTLLYWTLESLLAGDRIGSVEKLRIQAIKASVNAALKLERKWASK